MKKFTLLIATLLIGGVTAAQTITTVATGLLGPAGICKDYNGHLIVAESGTGNNDGRVSMLDTMGVRNTVVHGLPSYLDTVSGEISGPWRSYIMPDSMLMVLTGKGPDTLGGVDSVAGCILIFDLTGFIPGTDSLDVTDAVKIVHVQQWVLSNGFIDSNPYSLHHDSLTGNVYVVDAGANAIIKIDPAMNFSVLDTFPSIPHPSGGFPPFIEYVPTDIVADSAGSIYVCNLTGFSFVPGLSEIVLVDTSGFNHSTQVSGLSLAVDMEMHGSNSFYVLQFGAFDSTFMPVMGSASIVKAEIGGATQLLAGGFGPASGMTTDWSDGFYVTEIFTGNVIHITDLSTSIPAINNTVHSLSAYPNPFGNSIQVKYTLNESAKVSYTISDQLGKVVFTKDAGELEKGAQTFELNSKLFDLSSLKSGVYYLTVYSSKAKQTITIIKK